MSVENRYYKLNRILMKGIGLWPYQNSKWVYAQVIIMSSIYLSAIFAQLAVFMKHECTWDLTLKVLSTTFPTIATFLLYEIYYLNSDVMKEVMDHMYNDWTLCKHITEFNIMNNYADVVRLFTKVFVYILSIGIFITMANTTVLLILDAISPLNESRVRLYIQVEYFIDPIKYHYLFILHAIIIFVLIIITLVAVGMAFFSYCFHACAMFKIANYRMEITMDKNILQTYSPKMEHVIFERIINAINIHRRTIKYIKLLVSTLGKQFLVAIIISVISLSVNLFRFFKSIVAFTEIVEVLFVLASIFGHFCYMCFGNYLGQQITNCNAEIFNTVYYLPWYITSVNMQKLLLFILQNGTKDLYLSAAGIFNSSHECLTTLLTSSISYFTIIYALQ